MKTRSLLRWGLVLFSGLVFIAGVPLFVLTEQTDHYFAWTTQPSLTAAAFGAFYWASCALSLLSVREREWANA